MAGQPTPPRIVEAFAINAPTCTQAAPVLGGKTFPFPVDSQAAVLNGAASLNDGFPPLTMTDPSAGGTPPFGIDMNGVLYPHSAWVVYLAAGQVPIFDAALQTAMGGYALGAIVRDVTSATVSWMSYVDANESDPAVTPDTWRCSVPLHATSAPTAGTHTDVALGQVSDLFLDINTGAGNVTLDGFVALRDGQLLTASNTGANLLILGFASGSSANQIRANGANITILQNDSFTIQYSAAIGKWVVV